MVVASSHCCADCRNGNVVGGGDTPQRPRAAEGVGAVGRRRSTPRRPRATGCAHVVSGRSIGKQQQAAAVVVVAVEVAAVM